VARLAARHHRARRCGLLPALDDAAAPGHAALLDRLQGIAAAGATGPVRRTDVVHFDLNPANILHVDGRLTGVVDWNIPFTGAAQGDRGFDVATLLFYAYDLDTVRAQLWERAVAISGRPWTTVYLCHLVLRQVEWLRRHDPGSPEDERFTALATRVLDDCG
jgi:aminoglycoside phosphotransferase (APT) family kinase protein